MSNASLASNLSKTVLSKTRENEASKNKRLSSWDVLHAVEMAIACSISYWIMTRALSPFVGKPDDLLGGMWAAVATVFVFRETRGNTLSAAKQRLAATCISFALCLLYLAIFPFHPVGLAVLIGLGTLITMLLGWREDIVTTGITTCVVMVVAAMGTRQEAWHQPLLRLADTTVGIAVGVLCKWLGYILLPPSWSTVSEKPGQGVSN